MAQLRIIEMMVHGSKEILTSSVFFYLEDYGSVSCYKLDGSVSW